MYPTVQRNGKSELQSAHFDGRSSSGALKPCEAGNIDTSSLVGIQKL